MEREKVIIFSLIVMAISIFLVIKKFFIIRGEKLNGIVYKSKNVIVRNLQEGKGKNQKLVILGSGYSVNLSSNNRVIRHTPFQMRINPTKYSSDVTLLEVFYPYQSNGLETASLVLCEIIRKESRRYKKVILIGHSKSAICFTNMIKWLKWCGTDINFITISAPFKGTLVANSEKSLKKLNWFERNIYKLLFSSYYAEKDIIPHSVFLDNIKYDEVQDYEWINVISICPKRSTSIIDSFLIHIDNKLGLNGDGIVSEESQVFINQKSKRQIVTVATHVGSMHKGLAIIKNMSVVKQWNIFKNNKNTH